MLYSLYQFQQVANFPVHFMADQGQQFFRNPFNPASYTPMGRVAAAAFDMFAQSTRHYGKPQFGLDSTVIKGHTQRVREEIVHRYPFGQLKHFVRDGASVSDPKVLLVAPMSGHFATLLRGTVKELLPDHDVYITDWRDASDVPLSEGHFDLDDYIDYIINWLTALGSGCHVIAVCQPAVPVYAALALMEEQAHKSCPLSLTMMGGPIDTRINPTEVNRLATTRDLGWFERNVITYVPPPHKGMMRKVYPGFLQLAGFMSMNLGEHLMKHRDMFNNLVAGDGESADTTRAFYEEYRAVMDMTAEFYLQTIETVFQKHALPKGEMTHRGQPVNPKAITRTPILCVEGEKDDISGLGQTQAALDLASNLDSAKKHYLMAKGAGHYGIFNGSRWRTIIAPEVRQFIRSAR